MKTTTYRSQLLGELLDVLKREGMACSETAEALVELAVALSRYQEEGVSLYPRFIICDSLERVLPVVQGTERILVGQDRRTPETARLALKKCAPLARGAWVGFIERAEPGFRFGVFRESVSPISLDLRDTIVALKEEPEKDGVPKVVLVSQLADKVVEVIGARGQHLIVHLSAVADDQPSPRDDVEKLAAVISRRTPNELREAVESFLRTTLNSALRRGHGALVAVTEAARPDELSDGVPFDSPVDLVSAVEAHATSATPESLGRLLAYAELLEGVLSADGITIFSTGGKLLGYNAFVKQRDAVAAQPRALVGGARRRAHEVLRALVDEGKLFAAFMRSTDGAATLYGGNK